MNIAAIAPTAAVGAHALGRLPLLSRCFLDHRADGRWFVIPAHKRAAWEESKTSRAVPDFAKPIDSPKAITFTDPREFK